ncbi:MAG: addiction module protein [Candidatus Schekmanbacteria bacterium]|nr:addiction module protein [Candidatus Schekmanbacteria bacterium]
MKTEDIENEVLKLDPKARAHLARRLLASLDDLSPAEVEDAWAEEALHRDSDDESADQPANQVIRDARARLA